MAEKTTPLTEGTPPAPMDKDAVRARKAALLEEISSLPIDEEERKGNEPGTVINRGTLAEAKIPWTWADVKRRSAAGDWEFQEMTFISPITRKIGWNSLIVAMEAGVEITTYRVFYDLAVKSMREANINENYFGPLKPDERPTMPGQQTRSHRMGFGGLDPRGGGGTPAA